MKLKRKILVILIALSTLLAFMALTSPKDIPLYLVLIPFALIAVICFFLIDLILYIFRPGLERSRKSKLIAVAISVSFVNFLLLRSINQLSIQDILISASITIILFIYIVKFQLNT